MFLINFFRRLPRLFLFAGVHVHTFNDTFSSFMHCNYNCFSAISSVIDLISYHISLVLLVSRKNCVKGNVLSGTWFSLLRVLYVHYLFRITPKIIMLQDHVNNHLSSFFETLMKVFNNYPLRATLR